MDFTFSEEQQELRGMARAFLAECSSGDQIREVMATERGYDTEVWKRIAKEMGNVHTNRREFMGKSGGPIQYRDMSEMTDEQVESELRELASDLGYVPGPGVKH